MTLKIGENYNGFKLLEIEELKEINSKGRIFVHEKSGAKLFHVENEDDNKVFSISFRTPPKDSTGVAHILEHSVLCGSKKFPVKEPFVELLKGSLNTFLNAMTFGDKTMYPVASRNSKDFLNLMDVYFDAVLNPNIYKYPEIMRQEGWHYELNNKNEDITYKGVVYNEMKGALSSPESILMRKVSESLFPDTTYGVESGGDPDFIPELTQEKFLEFHKNYYHPSNSYIYLYGDMDLLETLKFMDDNYLKDYDKIEVDSKIIAQKPFKEQHRMEAVYPISSNEKEQDKTFFSLNYVIDNAADNAVDKELYMAFDILENVLLETPAAPLKKAIIDADLGKDVFGMFDNSILQPTFSIVVKNSNIDKEEAFKKVVYDTLNKLVKEGIDKKLIQSVINIKEFNLREADFNSYPKGLIYNIMCMDTWLYDSSPVVHLRYAATMEKLKAGVKSNYFEELIKKYILNNTHSSLLVVEPKKGLSETKDKELVEKLKVFKNSLSEAELDEIISQTASLTLRQTTGDSEENINKIPLLSLEDIDKHADRLPLEEKKDGILFHDISTNGIAYINMYFETCNVKLEQLPYITILSELLGMINTKNYSYEDLSNEININTGGISYGARAFMENGTDENFFPKFVVKAKALNSKVPKLMELISETVMNSKFDDKKRIKELVAEIKSRYEMKIQSEGHVLAAARVQSYFSPIGKYAELLSGISFYHFIVELEKDFDKNYDNLAATLKEISHQIFNKKSLLTSITSEEEELKHIKENLTILTKKLDNSVHEKQDYKFNLKADNEGLMTSGKVQFVAKGGNYKKLGFNYTGAMLLLKSVARYDYLWNRVRVQGGAYGCMASFSKNGNMYFTSYRDPNLKETLKIYDEMPAYLDKFKPDEREMTKYIIGTVSELDTPLTPSMKGQVATANFISKITFEDIQKERDEVLQAKAADISGLSKLIEAVMDEKFICVLGNEDKLKNNKDVFDKLVDIID